MGSYLTRTQAAEVSGLRAGPFGRWADGVTAMREDCAAFARHWQAHNDRVLAETGPLWVVLGDSTAQGLGAHSPDGGYVGQVLAELRRQTGLPWRVLNLSISGALTRASDCFHPSQDGYRDWARALLDVVNFTERTGRVPW
jgi:lysophospholipase L1-like esterase